MPFYIEGYSAGNGKDQVPAVQSHQKGLRPEYLINLNKNPEL